MALTDGIDRDRAKAGLLTAAAVAALGYALVAGLAVQLPVRAADVMKLFSVAPPAPPPREKPPPPHPHRARQEGAAAPPNRRSKATPVVAPTPVVPPLQPPPIVAAPVPAIGVNATSGAAPYAGPGTGAGGQGTGTGSGRAGNGSGDGGTPARVISRALRIEDLPGAVVRDALSGGSRLEVEAHYTVTAQGRVVDCRVTRSSGNRELDAATCRAMMGKLRYRPERDAAGRAIAVETDGYQTWESRNGYADDD